MESGALAVLYTWGHNLSLHPHIHCIVPAAGYTLDGRWKNIGHSGKPACRQGRYLYPVHQLSSALKGKFLDSLKRALRKQNELPLFYEKVEQAYKTRWVVHCEPSLAGAKHVIKYLGQYTHRVAITKQRILNIADGKVIELKARGGFEIDIEWEKGELKTAVIHSKSGRNCRIRTNKKSENIM